MFTIKHKFGGLDNSSLMLLLFFSLSYPQLAFLFLFRKRSFRQGLNSSTFCPALETPLWKGRCFLAWPCPRVCDDCYRTAFCQRMGGTYRFYCVVDNELLSGPSPSYSIGRSMQSVLSNPNEILAVSHKGSRVL